MTSPIQPNKTYGVLHTESYFSFVGFAKKIENQEIQKIDIYLDDKLIDTIEAKEFIQKLDDIYDVENQAFSYNLPTKYIGQKATIYFKYHDSQEELLNSPYTLIDKNHEDFNETRFIHSLNEPLSENLKNIYKPNSIGFLATKENLEDEEFVLYIKELMEIFPEIEFVGFGFNKNISNIFSYNFISINHIQQIRENVEIFLWNYKIDDKITPKIIGNIRNKNILSSFFMKELISLSIEEWEYKKENNIVKQVSENLNYFGFSKTDFDYAENSIMVMLNNVAKKYIPLDQWCKIDKNNTIYEFLNLIIVKYFLYSKEFKQYFYEIFHTKPRELND